MQQSLFEDTGFHFVPDTVPILPGASCAQFIPNLAVFCPLARSEWAIEQNTAVRVKGSFALKIILLDQKIQIISEMENINS